MITMDSPSDTSRKFVIRKKLSKLRSERVKTERYIEGILQKRMSEENQGAHRKGKIKRSATLFVAGKMNQIEMKRATSLDRLTKEIDSIYGKINVLHRSRGSIKDQVYDVID